MDNAVRKKSLSYRHKASGLLFSILVVAVYGCDAQFPGGAAQIPVEIPEAAAEPPDPAGCLVKGRIVSAGWRNLGGEIERAIVSVWQLPEVVRVKEVYGEGGRFDVRLPPGKYRIDFSANGTRGATFDGRSQDVTIDETVERIDVGDVDLPISKTTGLYGKPAPELEGIIAWHDTPPIALKDLRGKLVVLDFFAYYCTICHAHKPDLVKLRDKYADRGLVVLAIHDPSLKSIDEMREKMDKELQHVFHGDPPKFPMALDGQGEKSVFEAYGIHAVPAVILIDQQGRVVRRYHHEGKPELEADVEMLLRTSSKRNS